MTRGSANLAALLVLVVGACATAAPRADAPTGIQALLPARGNVAALPAEIVDRSGKLRGVEAVEPGMAAFDGRGFLLSEPHAPEALRLDWIGGACDVRVRFLVSEGGAGVQVLVATEQRGEACPAVGIPRAIRFVFSGPVIAGGVEFE